MGDVKVYKINDKEYIQRPLVLGQIQQLLSLLKKVAENLPEVDLDNLKEIKDTKEDITTANTKAKKKERIKTLQTISLLGDNLTDALAIVLCPSAISLAERDLEAIKKDLYTCPPETAMEVIADFLSINQNSPIWTKIAMILPPSLKVPVLKGRSKR